MQLTDEQITALRLARAGAAVFQLHDLVSKLITRIEQIALDTGISKEEHLTIMINTTTDDYQRIIASAALAVVLNIIPDDAATREALDMLRSLNGSS